MASAAQLVDQGVRAYVEGRADDARRLLDEALRLEPGNARARSYMILLHGSLPAAATPPPGALAAVSAPPPAPPPASPPMPASPPTPVADLPLPSGERAGVRGTSTASWSDAPFAPSPWDDGPAAASTILLSSDGGMDLEAVAEKSDIRPLVPEASREPVAPPPSSPRKPDVDVWMSAAKDLHALGDFSGSLEMIEKILKVDPEHGEARDYLRHNEATLVAMYESKLGPLGRIPRLAIKPEEVMWLNLDHRAGFLLSQIDGTVDYESLFALSGLPRLDTARILATLIADGVIGA